MLICLLTAAAPRAAAQQAERLVLQRGPYLEWGIPFIAGNLSPYYRSEYRLGDQQIEILFLRESRIAAGDWPPAGCDQPAVVQEFSDAGLVYAREFGAAGELLFILPSGVYVESDACRIMQAFTGRFSYFLGTTPDWYLPPFPAIVEL